MLFRSLGFLSVLVATLLSYPLDFFARFVPRVVALIVTLLLVVGAVVGLVFLLVPVVTAESAGAVVCRVLMSFLVSRRAGQGALWS